MNQNSNLITPENTLPELKKYDIIYADPPWSYYNDRDAKPDCTVVCGVRRPPYSVLSSKTIRKLNIQRIANENCALFIWTTDYHLDKCIDVIRDWGFDYSTVAFAWQKFDKKGDPVCFTGAYTLKSGIELCLLAKKGSLKGWVQDRRVRALVQSPRMSHSEKPDEVRKRIDRLFGEGKSKVELFARKSPEGWDTIGNEIDGRNILDTIGLRD